ncbi:MAG: O-antigen ligase family protein [Flavobacteriales bacterium]
MPVAKKLVPGFIALLALYCIVNCIVHRRIFLSRNIPALLMLAIFALHLIGLTYSEHAHDGLNEVGIKLSYLAFPIIGWLMPGVTHNQLTKISNAFIAGCVAGIVVMLVSAMIQYSEVSDISIFSYEKLSGLVSLHPTYAATYLAFAIFILLRNASLGRWFFSSKWIHVVCILAMLVFICMLASKAGFIAAGLSVLLGGWCWWKNNKSMSGGIAMVFSCAVVMFIALRLLPGASERIEAAVNDATTIAADGTAAQHEAHSSTELRMLTWKSSLELLLANPIGVGTGDTEYELVKKYEAKRESYAAQRRFNAHNQFLQAGAEHGWPALLLLLTLCLVLLRSAITTRDAALMYFILLCGMNFLFESFLETQAGIVFFCFWVVVFAKQKSVDAAHATNQST